MRTATLGPGVKYCMRFSTKSRMALESRADSGLNPLVIGNHAGLATVAYYPVFLPAFHIGGVLLTPDLREGLQVFSASSSVTAP